MDVRVNEGSNEQETPFWSNAVPASSSSVLTSDGNPPIPADFQACTPTSVCNFESAFKAGSSQLEVDCRVGEPMDLKTGLSLEMGLMHVNSQSLISQNASPVEPDTNISPKKPRISDDMAFQPPARKLNPVRAARNQDPVGNIDDLPNEVIEDERPISPTAVPEKKCRQCHATKTPMWRNDSEGNKTLCNACGVRLQRQVNKAKQNAQASIEPLPTLLAGKMPRSRTSPAKLSKEDLMKSPSNGRITDPASSRRPSTASAVEDRLARSENLVKRKSAERPSGGNYSNFERKRSCNDLAIMQSPGSPPETRQDLSCDCDLVVIGQTGGIQAATRIRNCTAALDLNVPGQPPGQLQIFMSGGRLAASCGFPKLDCQICYDSTLSAWRWDGTAVWKLLFLSAAAGKRFEGMLTYWKNLGNSGAVSPGAYSPHTQGVQFQSRRTSSFGNLGEVSALYKMNGSDFKFLDHINSKIRQEAGGNPLTTESKGLCTLVSNDLFERLMSMFELLRTRNPQPALTEQGIAALCQKCTWAPNRAVGIAIFRYWLSKVQRRAMRASVQGMSPTLFLESPQREPGSGFGAPQVAGLGPGMSDASAMTLQELPPLQGRGNSEESSGRSYRYEGALNASNRPAPGFQAQPMFPMHEDPLLSQSGSMFGGNTYMRPAWDPSFMIPNSEFEQQAQQDWDPLDPQNLARIADPNLEGTTSCTTPVLPPLSSLRSAEGSGFSPGLTMGPSGLQSPALLATPRGTPTPRAAGGPNSPFLPTEADFSTPPFRSPSTMMFPGMESASPRSGGAGLEMGGIPGFFPSNPTLPNGL